MRASRGIVNLPLSFQLADDDSAFEKERVPGKLTALAAYDIPLETYLASFNKPAA